MLYLNPLGNIVNMRELVRCYVTRHDKVLLHAVFNGQTTGEMYFGPQTDVPERLADRGQEARQIRLDYNHQAVCSRWPLGSPDELVA